MNIFYYFDLTSDKIFLGEQMNTLISIYEKATGTSFHENFEKSTEEQLNKFFDALEEEPIIVRVNIIHLLLDLYYVLSDNTDFIRFLGNGMGRQKFEFDRNIIMAAVSDDEDEILPKEKPTDTLLSYNNSMKYVIVDFKHFRDNKDENGSSFNLKEYRENFEKTLKL